MWINATVLLRGGHEGAVVRLGDFLEPGGGNEGDGHGGETLDLDNDTLALLDALDGADSALEIALGDADALTGLGNEVGILEEGDAGVLGIVDAAEIVHLAVGDHEDSVVLTLREAISIIVHGLELAAGHLQLGEVLLGGANENQPMDSRNELLADVPVISLRELAAHGEEILQMLVFEQVAEVEHAFDTAVGNAHGVPEH